MELFDVTDELSINLEFVKAIERVGDGTRVYIELDDQTKTVLATNVPYEQFRMVLKRRKQAEYERQLEAGSIARNIRQIAKNQFVPTP